MLNTTTTASPPAATTRKPAVAERIGRTLELLQKHVPLTRRVVRDGDRIYQVGERLDCLYVINSGFFKIVNLSADGREQVVGLQFRATGSASTASPTAAIACDAIAMDTGEVWAIATTRCCWPARRSRRC